MRKRVLGVVASVVLATVGTFLVLSYVRGADERALADETAVEVLVVTDTITKGEAADAIADRVRRVLVPAKVQAVGSVASLADLEGQVAAVELIEGEQVVAQRFVTPEVLEDLDDFRVPEGLLEVTVSIEPARAVGGNLEPGDLVAFVASFDPFELSSVEPTELDEATVVALEALFQQQQQEGDPFEPPDFSTAPDRTLSTPNTSHIILHKLLVTDVKIERLPTPTEREDAEDAGVALAPTGNLLVTLAATAPEVEQIVFTAEHGEVWLAGEPASADEAGTQIQTRNSIYR